MVRGNVCFYHDPAADADEEIKEQPKEQPNGEAGEEKADGEEKVDIEAFIGNHKGII